MAQAGLSDTQSILDARSIQLMRTGLGSDGDARGRGSGDDRASAIRRPGVKDLPGPSRRLRQHLVLRTSNSTTEGVSVGIDDCVNPHPTR